MSTAVLLPGSASNSDFVRRAFSALLTGVEICGWTPRGGDAEGMAAQLSGVVDGFPGQRVIVIGVSIGAHAAALWASTHHRPDTFLIVAMPAWTGPAADVAAVTEVAAQRISEHGLAAELQMLTAQYPDDWVTGELVRAWRGADPTHLIATLRATACSHAPTISQLHNIGIPTLVVGLHDDPMHPWTVAQQWAAAIPTAELVGLDRGSPQSDIAVFGRSCLDSDWARLALRQQP